MFVAELKMCELSLTARLPLRSSKDLLYVLSSDDLSGWQAVHLRTDAVGATHPSHQGATSDVFDDVSSIVSANVSYRWL